MTMVPDSCKCDINSEAEDCGLVGLIGIYNTGCYTKLEPTLRDLVDAMGGIAIAISFVEVRLVTFTFRSDCSRDGFISVGGWNFLRLSRKLLQRRPEARIRLVVDPVVGIKASLCIYQYPVHLFRSHPPKSFAIYIPYTYIPTRDILIK